MCNSPFNHECNEVAEIYLAMTAANTFISEN